MILFNKKYDKWTSTKAFQLVELTSSFKYIVIREYFKLKKLKFSSFGCGWNLCSCIIYNMHMYGYTYKILSCLDCWLLSKRCCTLIFQCWLPCLHLRCPNMQLKHFSLSLSMIFPWYLNCSLLNLCDKKGCYVSVSLQ